MGKWKTVQLGDIVHIINGFAFQSRNYVEEGHRVIRITNVQKGVIVDNDPEFYLPCISLYKYELFENDLLISLTGNVGRVGLIKKDLLPAYLNQRVACLRLKNNSISRNFIFSYLNSDEFERACIESSNGIAQKNMSTEWLKKCQIPLPPLDVQQKIADVLDKASALIELRRTQLDKLDLLIKSQFIEMFGDPVTNPMGWPEYSVDELTESIDAGECLNGESRPRNDGEKAVLKVSAVTYGYFKPNECKVLINTQDIKKNVTPKKGDLLFSRANTRELVAATAIVDKDYPDLLLPDKLWKLNLNGLVIAIYMKQALSSKSAREYFSGQATGTSGSMFNVSMGKLGNLSIGIPSLGLQNEFAAFVEQVENQKKLLQQSLAQLELNYKSLMQKCFRGEIF